MKYKQLIILIIILSLLIFLIGGCSQKFVEQTSGFKVDFKSLSLPDSIDKKYLIGSYPKDEAYSEYDLHNSLNPLFYDKEKREFVCSKFGDKAKKILVFSTNKFGGASRTAHYCRSENVYYIQDFLGNLGFGIYGPFEGYPE